jgi:hypothetical protein
MKSVISLLKSFFPIFPLLISTLLGNAQNSIFTLPSNYLVIQPNELIDENTLPIPFDAEPIWDYDGQIAENAHNAMHDENGELMFFIVDHVVFDKDGYRIGELLANISTWIKGYAETLIIPDPENCQRYYIVSSGRIYYDFSYANFLPFYGLVDMSLPNNNSPALDRNGVFVDNNGNPIPAGNPTLTALATTSSGFVQQVNKQGCMLAASDLLQDGSRMLFISNGYSVFRYRVDGNGINFDNYSFGLPNPNFNSQILRCEMELKQLTGGNYRIAVPYIYDEEISPGINITKYAIFIADLFSNGQLIPLSSSILCFEYTANDNPRPYLHGLEFSPNGEILYITHNASTLHSNPIEYFDLSNPQLGVQPLLVNDAIDFEHTQIELGLDGNLYFSGGNRIAVLVDPNTPSPNNWIDDYITLNHDPNYMGATNPSTSYKAYVLPDQIDGMNYFAHFNTPECCLQFPTTDKIVYVAEESATWTATLNPLNNGTGSVAYIREELRIPAGITVTIQGMRVEFFEDAKCIIEPGGHLILDNTVFTAGPCENIMWLGVEVWGNPSLPQYPATNQGVLQLKNNSVIEHARIAALMARRVENQWGGYYHDMQGGFVLAYNSSFRNNEKDAVIREYANNQLTISNRCKFTNCMFLTDGPLNYAQLNPQYHAELYKVHDVQFLNCTFLNTASFQDYPIGNRGTGIWSAWSTFRAKGENNSFIGDVEQANESFFQLNQGVLSVGDETSYFSITGMEFQDNQVGLAVSGSCRQMITYNNFYVPAGDNPDYNPSPMGSYFLNSYLFTLEENAYVGASNESINYGAIAWNTSRFGLDQNQHYFDGQSPVENEFYRNQFTELQNGITVIGFNAAVSGSFGLQTRCNEFSDCVTDINLVPGSEWRDPQGNTSAPELYTNNLFSYPDHYCQAPTDDVLAPDEYGNVHPSWPLTFRYICFDEAATRPFVNAVNCPEPPLVLETFGTGLNFEEHCPVQIHKPWIPGPVEDKLVTLSIEKSLQNSAIELYGLTINGGETEDLLQILADAHAYESDFLRNMLLQRYPLSNEVMQSAIERASSFDPWHLTQVLIANARLDLNIMSFLEESEVLSPFFMEFIYQANATGNNSLKEILKQEISHRSYVRSVTERDIMRSYLYESDSIDYSGWNQFVSNQNEEYYKLYRLFDNLNNSNLTQAQAWRDSLKYVHPDHLDWIDMVISIATSDTITQQNIDDVWDIYSYNDVIMGDALAWLIGNQLTNEIPLPPLQPGNPRSLSTRKPIKQLQHLTFLQAWPNPATDRVMLTYPNETDGMGVIQIFNQQGVLVHQVAAQGRGIAEINTTQWSPGIYIALLKVEGKVFDEVKISVVK